VKLASKVNISKFLNCLGSLICDFHSFYIWANAFSSVSMDHCRLILCHIKLIDHLVISLSSAVIHELLSTRSYHNCTNWSIDWHSTSRHTILCLIELHLSLVRHHHMLLVSTLHMIFFGLFQ
jgi:hypothetical protein